MYNSINNNEKENENNCLLNLWFYLFTFNMSSLLFVCFRVRPACLPHTNEPTIVLFVVNNCIPPSIYAFSATELIYIFGAEFQNMYLTERRRVCAGVEGKRAHI